MSQPLQRLRAPYAIPWREHFPGRAGLVANIDYMLADTNEPPALEVVDAALDWPHNGPDADRPLVRYFISRGLSVRVIHPFDEARYLAEGLEYLREYSPYWSEAREPHMPRQVIREQYWLELLRSGYAASESYSHEVRLPVLQDVISHLDGRHVVIAYCWHGMPSSAPSGLFGLSDDELQVVSPYVVEDDDPSDTQSLRSFERDWQPDAGLMIVSRPLV